MPSSYTPSLRLVLPVTGELTGAWGDVVNAGLTELVEDALAGSAAVAMANANVTLSVANAAVDQSRNMFINLTGAHTAQRDVIVPAVSKLYFVNNGTTGGFGVQVKTAAGTGVVVPNGQRMALYCDGTNVLFAFGSSVGRSVLLAADAAEARTALGALNSAAVSAFGLTLVDDPNAATARATLGTDIYKSVPGNAALTAGEMYKATGAFTLNTGAAEGTVYTGINNSASAITITQGAGLTLRLAGTTSTGNRTITARGMFSIWALSTTEYYISGAGVS